MCLHMLVPVSVHVGERLCAVSAARQVTLDQFEAFSQNGGFSRMSEEMLCDLVVSNALTVEDSEDVVLEAVGSGSRQEQAKRGAFQWGGVPLPVGRGAGRA